MKSKARTLQNLSRKFIENSISNATSVTNGMVDSAKNITKETVAISTAIGGGAVATTVGVLAAGTTTTTAAISAVGAAVGGISGGVLGSSMGLVGGFGGMVATVPFATAGAAIGGYAGEVALLFGVGTAPAWAIPVAIGGAVVMVSGGAIAGYKFYQSKSEK